MRVLVCGSRDWSDHDSIWREMGRVASLGRVTFVHGGARGADSLAGEAARQLAMPVEVYPADWRTHGKAAGPIRNRAMLASGIGLVLAFGDGRGTRDTVRAAGHLNIPVRRFGVDG